MHEAGLTLDAGKLGLIEHSSGQEAHCWQSIELHGSRISCAARISKSRSKFLQVLLYLNMGAP